MENTDPLGQRKGIISASSTVFGISLLSVHFLRRQKRQKCTFPKFLLILERFLGAFLPFAPLNGAETFDEVDLVSALLTELHQWQTGIF